jgi:hypothetical protein
MKFRRNYWNRDRFMARNFRCRRVGRRYGVTVLVLACVVAPLLAPEKTDDGPTNEKAQKTYKEALDELHRGMRDAALDWFKKADKHDGGHCLACQKKMIR